MAEISTQIEQLDKNNYQAWKFRIRNFLIGKIFWVLVIGDEKKPIVAGKKSNLGSIKGVQCVE